MVEELGRKKMENEIEDGVKKSRIQVSNSKKSLFFYVNLSKRYLQQYGEADSLVLEWFHNLLALFIAYTAITTVVTIAEILKNSGFAVEKKIRTLTIDMRDDPAARPVPKAKIEVLLGKSANFDELMAAETEGKEIKEGDDQN